MKLCEKESYDGECEDEVEKEVENDADKNVEDAGKDSEKVNENGCERIKETSEAKSENVVEIMHTESAWKVIQLKNQLRKSEVLHVENVKQDECNVNENAIENMKVIKVKSAENNMEEELRNVLKGLLKYSKIQCIKCQKSHRVNRY